jgi:hypothetical protein
LLKWAHELYNKRETITLQEKSSKDNLVLRQSFNGNSPMTMGEMDSDMMPEQFWWAFNQWVSWNPMKNEKGNWKIKGVEPGNRTIVHVHVNPGMMAKNRSQCMCYYYFGDYKKTGVYEMIASD